MPNKPYKKDVKKMKGKPFDEFRCFYIKDFRKGDSIRVTSRNKHERFTRGIVTEVDLQNCLIHYRTKTEEDNVTTIDRILSLEGFVQDFLNKDYSTTS